MNQITKIRVTTRGIIPDIIARVKNTLGMRISEYESMIQKMQDEIWQEIEDEGLDLKWFRYEISQLTTGAMVIMLYGEVK